MKFDPRRLAHIMALTIASAVGLPPALAASSPAGRAPEDDVIYFVLPDRFENADSSNDKGGYSGGALEHGFKPDHKGFYHGGDLKGLIKRLDYIDGLGATAIWLGPIYKNKPVQGAAGSESSGYHGYWITDFLDVDPHFGSRKEMKAFVEAAHKRGMKVYLDIITNHTADVIAYRECHDPDAPSYAQPKGGCPYRSKADYPYARQGGVDGKPINKGFMGDGGDFQTEENFKKLTNTNFAYTPYVPKGQEKAKNPSWLNDVRYYHNRGDNTWEGESVTYGDFVGLDDLMTEDPRVVAGFIDIFKRWISDFKIDGFRIDTAKHVNPEFWRAFVPAIQDHARKEGLPNFYIFGEVFDPEPVGLAPHTRVGGMPQILDFGFQSAVSDVVANGAPSQRLARFFDADVLYEGGAETARRLPTFLGNHDMGRIGHFIMRDKKGQDGALKPAISQDDGLKRSILAHAMLFYLRGVPTIYYGDEQGFVGDGGDQDAREDMFPSKVAIYNDNDLLGTDATTAEENFDRKHPLYRAIARMAEDRAGHEPLRRGAQVTRFAEPKGGVFAASRLDTRGGEFLAVFNSETAARSLYVAVDPRSEKWTSIAGGCAKKSAAPGSVKVDLPPLSFIVCRSNSWEKKAQ
jgi:glycosidase